MRWILKVIIDNEKYMDVECERSDNIASIKRKIRLLVYIDERKLEIEYDDDRSLRNNEYLSDDREELRFHVENSATFKNEIFLHVHRNNIQVPHLLQFSKSDKISHVKRTLQEVIKSEEPVVIFREDLTTSDKLVDLYDNDTIETSHLYFDSEIKVCLEKDTFPKLTVSSLLPVTPSRDIHCHISDLISKVKEQICREVLGGVNTQLSLFTERELLRSDSRLINHCIKTDSFIFYVETDSRNDIEKYESIRKGKFGKIFRGKKLSTNGNIVLKKYNLKGEKMKNFIYLKNELTVLLKLKIEEYPEILMLECMFEDNDAFYIGMEYMEKGSLDKHIPVNEEDLLITYSIGILNALIHLHNNRIIYRNLKCSNVLLGADNSVKLTDFHFSKYLQDYNSDLLPDRLAGSEPLSYNWMAPEVLSFQKYGMKADIWSFGATVIEMATGRIPYPEEKRVKATIIRNKTIVYDSSNVSRKVQYIINFCIQDRIDLRPTAAELKDILIN